MTTIVSLRDRLASHIRLTLGHQGVTIDANAASVMAEQALKNAQVAALADYVAAVEAGAAVTAARAVLAADPVTNELLAVAP